MKLYKKKPKYEIGDIVIIKAVGMREKKYDLLGKIISHRPHSRTYNYETVSKLNNPNLLTSTRFRWTYKSYIKGIPLKKDLIFDLL